MSGAFVLDAPVIMSWAFETEATPVSAHQQRDASLVRGRPGREERARAERAHAVVERGGDRDIADDPRAAVQRDSDVSSEQGT